MLDELDELETSMASEGPHLEPEGQLQERAAAHQVSATSTDGRTFGHKLTNRQASKCESSQQVQRCVVT